MIYATARKLEASADVVSLQVWQLVQNRLLRQPCPKQIKHICHANAHPPDARASSHWCGFVVMRLEVSMYAV